MDLNSTIDEIGILETNLQLEKHINNYMLMDNVSNYIPVPSNCITSSIVDMVTKQLVDENKKNILMLSNEIALIDKLSEYKDTFENIIVVLSRNLDNEQIENIKNNVSKKINVKFINELEFPTMIKPKNTIMLSFGYRSGSKYLLTKNHYRTLQVYKGFLGEKIFVSCFEKDINYRPKNWISFNNEGMFTRVI